MYGVESEERGFSRVQAGLEKRKASGRWQLMLGLLEMMARPTALCLATAVETCEKGILDEETNETRKKVKTSMNRKQF